MPAFRQTFDPTQLAALIRYLRTQFAPDQPEWTNLEPTITRIHSQR